jgi:SAM-dependent methyltransferase
MKLSELVAYRNQLALTNVGSIAQVALGDVDKIQYVVNANKLALNFDNQQLQDQKIVIQQAFNDFGMLIDTLKQQVDQLINSLEHPYFVDSYTLYENDFENETAEDLADRHPKLSECTVEYLTARIRRYNSWKYPAMILRPGVETYINDMVACDPLYLVDLKHELLEATTTQYNQVYQQRLRTYVVDERGQNIILNKLPDSQLGVILAYNYFNFRPFEVIKKWLTELLTKLKPGGVLLMTFNDCDNEKAVMLVEQNYCCYTPGHLIMQLAQTLGFEILHKWSDGGPSTWLELKRPGTIHSVRGGQALAKILPKPVAESK